MKKRQRVCDICSKPYYRSNRIRLWITRNEGHRDGWRKADDKICLKCLNAAATMQAARVFGIRIVGSRRKKEAA